jgi:hypothetical protein
MKHWWQKVENQHRTHQNREKYGVAEANLSESPGHCPRPARVAGGFEMSIFYQNEQKILLILAKNH